MDSETRPITGEKRAGGIICPVATPLEGGQVGIQTLRHHMAWLEDSVDGLLILGSSGEFAALSTQARREVGRAIDKISDGLTVFVGVGEASTERVIEELAELPDRADYAAVTAPYYFAATSQRALMDHFTAVANVSAKPIILYNLPQNTGVSIAPQTLGELSAHPNIHGIKDSSGDMLTFTGYIDVRPPEFLVMQGREQLAAISLWLGADGIISALSNFAPHELQRLVTAVRAGRDEEARAQQRRVTGLAQIFSCGHWIAALKASLEEIGISAGDPVPPLEACTVDQRVRIRELLSTFDIQGPGRDAPAAPIPDLTSRTARC